MMTVLIVISVAALAWWNGANDNFKGVATLYGTGSSYRVALTWATVTQIAGSLLATVLAAGLFKTFSGKGIVPDVVAADPAFLGAVAIGGMSTILLATIIGMPVSTTHALTGALVGAGLVAVGTDLNVAALGTTFFVPLLTSPLIAMALTMVLYALAHHVRKALGVTSHRALDSMHFVSAGAICFARALNDTPKIFALCLSAHAVGASVGMPAIAAAMAAGGVMNSRKVAMTLSKKITPLNRGQGLVANVVTAMLVVVASRAGLPVSTTHVSTSAVFGIGAVNRSAHARTILQILGAWVITLPAGAIIGAATYWICTR